MSSVQKQFGIAFSLALSVVALFFAGLWFYQKEPTLGGNFTLIHEGNSWTFSDHAKKINLLYVGYAKCPDVCPMALSYSAFALQKLNAEENANIQFVFISVDASHDTAENVSTYAKQFNTKFIGLTGKQEDIDNTIKLFGASYVVEENPKSYLGYSIAHTDKVFILNKKGHVIDSVPSPRSAEEIIIKIKEHL